MALLCILFSKNSGSISARIWWKPFPGQRMEKPFTMLPVIWRNRSFFPFYFMCVLACVCVCVQVWISCQVQERCSEKEKVKGFTDKVTFHSQSIKIFNATLRTFLKVKILSFSLTGFEMKCITSALLLFFFVVSSLPTYPKKREFKFVNDGTDINAH